MTPATTDDDGDLAELSQLLQAIKDNEDELHDLDKQRTEFFGSRKSQLESLVEQTSIEADEMGREYKSFEDEKGRLEAQLKDKKALRQHEHRRQQQKLKQLRDELIQIGLSLEDLRRENQKLDDNLERYHDAMQRLGATSVDELKNDTLNAHKPADGSYPQVSNPTQFRGQVRSRQSTRSCAVRNSS